MARIRLYEKLEESSRPGGALNYAPRIAESGQRILKDLADSYVRIDAVAKGVRAVYGISPLSLPVTRKHTYLDESIRWLRDVAERVQRITMQDQALVLRVMLSRVDGGAFSGTKEQWAFELKSVVTPVKLPRLS